MANADSNTPKELKQTLINGREALDNVNLILSGVNGLLDCLFTLSCQNGTQNLNLCEGSLNATLDLAVRQIALAKETMGIAYNSFTHQLNEVAP